VLLNASPDLRRQIDATPELAPPPGAGPRASPVEAVILTSGELDHVAGLLSLREGLAFTLYASERVLDSLASNTIFNVLDQGLVRRTAIRSHERVELAGPEASLGLIVGTFSVPGKVALYLEDAAAGPDLGTREGDTIGLKITDPATAGEFFYIPGCAAIDAALARRLRGAQLVMFDGTLYADDEMISQGLSPKSGRRMGHMSMSGPGGSVAAFSTLDVKRRIFVHINNSNPVLYEAGPEREEVERAGWEVAYDGMEIRL
jgi:pyrroloquinoline quinone biosynthesis protein B